MSMTSEELASFNSRRAGARNNYSNYLAGSTYNRGVAAQDYTQHSQRATQQWDQQRQNVPDEYLRRGILHSGLYGQGLNNYAQARQQNLGDLSQGYQRQQAQYGFGEQNAAGGMNDALAMIDQQEAARRADIAASLKGLY